MLYFRNPRKVVLIVLLSLLILPNVIYAQGERVRIDVRHLAKFTESVEKMARTFNDIDKNIKNLEKVKQGSKLAAKIRYARYIRLVGYPALVTTGAWIIADSIIARDASREQLENMEQYTWLDGELQRFRAANLPAWMRIFNKEVGRFPNAVEIEVFYTALFDGNNEGEAYKVVNNWRLNPRATPGLALAVQIRSEELQKHVFGQVTVSVGAGVDEKGNLMFFLGTSNALPEFELIDLLLENEDFVNSGLSDEYLRELFPGDINITHAEIKVLDGIKDKGYTPLAIGAGRPHCRDCWDDLIAAEVVPTGLLKSVFENKLKKKLILDLPVANHIWSGTWITSWSKLDNSISDDLTIYLTNIDNVIAGLYIGDQGVGAIKGVITGITASGTWTGPEGESDFSFRLDESGKSFFGTWSDGIWDGQLIEEISADNSFVKNSTPPAQLVFDDTTPPMSPAGITVQ